MSVSHQYGTDKVQVALANSKYIMKEHGVGFLKISVSSCVYKNIPHCLQYEDIHTNNLQSSQRYCTCM